MENPIKMDDLGGKPTIFGNIQIGGAQIVKIHPLYDINGMIYMFFQIITQKTYPWRGRIFSKCVHI